MVNSNDLQMYSFLIEFLERAVMGTQVSIDGHWSFPISLKPWTRVPTHTHTHTTYLFHLEGLACTTILKLKF